MSQSKTLKDTVIYTPIKLEGPDRAKALKLVQKLTGEIVSDASFMEDENLVDGMKIIYKDKLWDFSLQSQLQSIVGE